MDLPVRSAGRRETGDPPYVTARDEPHRSDSGRGPSEKSTGGNAADGGADRQTPDPGGNDEGAHAWVIGVPRV